VTNGSLLDTLRGIVGSEHLVTHERQLATYASDGLLQYAVTPVAVVLPGSAEEVAAVVRACHEAEAPWVARGAGSGLSGGALPVEEMSCRYSRCRLVPSGTRTLGQWGGRLPTHRP
jgi:glycolate oxidase